ncbi:MAG: SulP family inorganic anion transporter [Planctomycetota bacterium]
MSDPPTDPALTPHRRNLTKDFFASIVVFLVALPLCIGIAQASGVPVAAGLITGIVGGLVVGVIAGSPLQVSGPAAGLFVIVLGIMKDFEATFTERGLDNPYLAALGALGIITLLAGVLQIGAGYLKLGQWFRAVSPAVIQGMLAGIGVLIFASQFHVMVHRDPPGGGIGNLVGIPVALWDGIHVWDFNTHHQAALVGLITIISIVAWQFMPKTFRVVPGALVGVILGSATAVIGNQFFGLFEIDRIEPGPGILEEAWTAVVSSKYTMLGDAGLIKPIIVGAVTIALVASAETLLCATAVDQMHGGPRTKYDQELKAQGVGNILCGALGGLPMTGVIVRSSANVDAGATSRWSAVIHGGWLLLFVAVIPFVLNYIPKAVLAGVLVFTGYKLVNIAAIKKLKGFGWSEVGIYAATVAGVVAIDLLTGVIIGIVLSFAKLLYTFSHLEIRKIVEGTTTVICLNGTATVLGLPKLASTLESIKPGQHVQIRFEDLQYIDHACLTLIGDWQRQHEATGGSLAIDWESLNTRYRDSKPLAVEDEQLPRATDSAVASAT